MYYTSRARIRSLEPTNPATKVLLPQNAVPAEVTAAATYGGRPEDHEIKQMLLQRIAAAPSETAAKNDDSDLPKLRSIDVSILVLLLILLLMNGILLGVVISQSQMLRSR
jgi:hypothetical protein